MCISLHHTINTIVYVPRFCQQLKYYGAKTAADESARASRLEESKIWWFDVVSMFLYLVCRDHRQHTLLKIWDMVSTHVPRSGMRKVEANGKIWTKFSRQQVWLEVMQYSIRYSLRIRALSRWGNAGQKWKKFFTRYKHRENAQDRHSLNFTTFPQR